MSKLREAAEAAKLLLDQLNHIGDALEYDELDDESALSNVAGIIAQSPAHSLLAAALAEPPEEPPSVAVAGLGFRALGLACSIASTMEQRRLINEVVDALIAECRRHQLLSDAHLIVIEKTLKLTP